MDDYNSFDYEVKILYLSRQLMYILRELYIFSENNIYSCVIYTVSDSFPYSGVKKHLSDTKCTTFQKPSETTFLRCNNSSENNVPKRYG
jgi:hypothetical protein